MAFPPKGSGYVRRSLGPDYTGMTCLVCGSPALHGLIDKNGRPYVSCEHCRFRALSLSLAGVACMRFMGSLLANDAVRKAWAGEAVTAMAAATAPLPGVVAPGAAAEAAASLEEREPVQEARRAS